MYSIHLNSILVFSLCSQVVAFGGLKKEHIKGHQHPSIEQDTVATKNTGRRLFLSSAVPLSYILISVTGGVKSASARDELFKPNPLTNPILEQVL
jgi:hypothetical protein